MHIYNDASDIIKKITSRIQNLCIYFVIKSLKISCLY